MVTENNGSARNKPRLDYIDWLKGIGILIIMWGHLYESPAKEFTNSFKVPLFFVLSGVLIGLNLTDDKSIDMKKITVKKLKSLMIPYLWFSLFDCIYDMVVYHQLSTVERIGYATVTGRGLYTLWFLPALFLAVVGFYCISNMAQKSSIALKGRSGKENRNANAFLIIALLLCLVITCLLNYGFIRLQDALSGSVYSFVSYPFLTIFHAMVGLVFTIIGFFLGRYLKKPQFKITLIVGIVAFSLGLILNLYCKNVDLNMGSLGNLPALFYLTAVLISVGGVLLMSLLPNSKVFSPLVWFGRNSMILMVTHLPIGVAVATGILEMILPNPNDFGFLFYSYTFVALTICLVVEYIFVKVINRKFRFLLGHID